MNLKKILPVENYILTTRLPVEEVHKRLSERIQPKKSFSIGPVLYPHKEYEGHISAMSFEISRIIAHRNSFLPVIKGNVSTFLGKTQIDIKMRLPTFSRVFLCFWLGLVMLGCIAAVLVGTSLSHKGFSTAYIAPFFMLAVGIVIGIVPFKVESKKSKAFLASLLEGEEMQ